MRGRLPRALLALLAGGVLLAPACHAHRSGGELGGRPGSAWRWLKGVIPSALAAQAVQFSIEGAYRVVRADGLPDHVTGDFPNRSNPNRISAQQYEFRMPAEPVFTGRTVPLGMAAFGVAVNGVPFDPGAAEFWNNDRRWQYEALSGAVPLGLDRNNAHVQPNGAYHYHGLPTALFERLSGSSRQVLLGWAADGHAVYGPHAPAGGLVAKLRSSYRLRPGERDGGPGGRHDGSFVQDWEYVAGSGDLDECNGRHAATPEFPGGAYHYVITDAFPFIPRCFKGAPDRSFAKGPPRDGGPGKGPPGGRPPGKGFWPPPSRY